MGENRSHTHEQRVAFLRVKTRYCYWCGAAIVSDQPPPDQAHGEYCSKQHMVQAAKMRRKRRQRERFACPTPTKRCYYERGDVIVWAAIHNQYGYACQCGFYHLTSEVPHSAKTWQPLNDLVAKKRAEMASAVKTVSVVDGVATVDLSTLLAEYVNKHGESLQTQIDSLWTANQELAREIASLRRPKPTALPRAETVRSLGSTNGAETAASEPATDEPAKRRRKFWRWWK